MPCTSGRARMRPSTSLPAPPGAICGKAVELRADRCRVDETVAQPDAERCPRHGDARAEEWLKTIVHGVDGDKPSRLHLLRAAASLVVYQFAKHCLERGKQRRVFVRHSRGQVLAVAARDVEDEDIGHVGDGLDRQAHRDRRCLDRNAAGQALWHDDPPFETQALPSRSEQVKHRLVAADPSHSPRAWRAGEEIQQERQHVLWRIAGLVPGRTGVVGRQRCRERFQRQQLIQRRDIANRSTMRNADLLDRVVGATLAFRLFRQFRPGH